MSPPALRGGDICHHLAIPGEQTSGLALAASCLTTFACTPTRVPEILSQLQVPHQTGAISGWDHAFAPSAARF